MPELPEVETVRRGLEKALKGRKIKDAQLRRANLRIPFPPRFAEFVAGRKLLAVRRRAKYLLVELSGGKTLLMHLGMSGKILVKEKPPRQFDKHDHLVMTLDNGTVLLFHDPRRFGLVTLFDSKREDQEKLLAHLGPEPLDKTFTGAVLHRSFAGRKQAVKVALMDQETVVGVGNIYASEALFDARIAPTLAASKVSEKQCAALVAAIKKVLDAAIASGGSTLRDYVRSDGDVGYFQHHFKVYGRDGKTCVRCKTPIRKITQAARSTYFCPHCQRT